MTERTQSQEEQQEKQPGDDHWLARPATITWLWRGFVVILAVTLLAQLMIYVKGYFGVDGWFGFGAAFGFLSCVVMVLVAKGLGVVLKRNDGYYRDGDDES